MNIYDSEVRVVMITLPQPRGGRRYRAVRCRQLLPGPDGGTVRLDGPAAGARAGGARYKAEITGPASKPLHYLVKDGEAEFNLTTTDGLNTYTWEVSDVPRIVAEPAMPSYYSFAPRLLVSTIDDWSQISRWWADMTQQFRVADDSLKATGGEYHRRGLTSDEDKIKAVYHFVAQKIRYMGLGTGKKAGFEPKPATETLATRYGVCRDVALLMSTMLDQLDIKSYVVLTRAGRGDRRRDSDNQLQPRDCGPARQQGRLEVQRSHG